MKAKITGGAAGLPNAAGDRGEAPGDGGPSGWRSMSPDGYPPPAICSCCGTGAGRWSSELRRCARRRAAQAAAPLRQPRLYARCRRRRSGSHCRHGRLDHQPGLSGWRIRIVLRGCHRVPDSDFGKSRTATWYPPTLGSRWCCLYSPSAFAVREHAETAADEANNGEGYTERILRLSCLQRLSGRAVTDGPEHRHSCGVDPPVPYPRRRPGSVATAGGVSGRQAQERALPGRMSIDRTSDRS